MDFLSVSIDGNYQSLHLTDCLKIQSWCRYAEAKEKYGITQPRFMRAIDDLIDKGFLDVVKNAIG